MLKIVMKKSNLVQASNVFMNTFIETEDGNIGILTNHPDGYTKSNKHIILWLNNPTPIAYTNKELEGLMVHILPKGTQLVIE